MKERTSLHPFLVSRYYKYRTLSSAVLVEAGAEQAATYYCYTTVGYFASEVEPYRLRLTVLVRYLAY